MKKLLLTVFVLFLTMQIMTSCEKEPLDEDFNASELLTGNETFAIDPPKACPPNDRNCNGIPDDQEN